MEVRFIDTTFRDGAQSLWAGGIRTGMMAAVAENMDRAGFDPLLPRINFQADGARPRTWPPACRPGYAADRF